MVNISFANIKHHFVFIHLYCVPNITQLALVSSDQVADFVVADSEQLRSTTVQFSVDVTFFGKKNYDYIQTYLLSAKCRTS